MTRVSSGIRRNCIATRNAYFKWRIRKKDIENKCGRVRYNGIVVVFWWEIKLKRGEWSEELISIYQQLRKVFDVDPVKNEETFCEDYKDLRNVIMLFKIW